jgi:hypothetical protein
MAEDVGEAVVGSGLSCELCLQKKPSNIHRISNRKQNMIKLLSNMICSIKKTLTVGLTVGLAVGYSVGSLDGSGVGTTGALVVGLAVGESVGST